MVEKGYTNVSICNSKLTELTTDLEKEDLQKYNFGNIAIRGIAKISIIDNNIISYLHFILLIYLICVIYFI